MLIHQDAQSGASRRQGSRRVSLAELRRQLADPTAMTDGYRQRLLDLAGRLARVQALTDKHAPAELSEYAQRALAQATASL